MDSVERSMLDSRDHRGRKNRPMSEPAGNVLPIYFVADESGSMADQIDELNAGLASLLDAMAMQSVAAAKIRLSVVGFSDDAVCHLPVSDLREVERMPRLAVRGSTSYVAAFEYLRRTIPTDIATLRSAGYAVHRPAVFFLSDGLPNDGDQWEASLARLTGPDFPQRPNIVAFGIGTADPKVIVAIASKPDFAFQAAAGSDTGLAIAKFSEALTHSIVTSGQSLASGQAELQGTRPEGFVMAIDLLD